MNPLLTHLGSGAGLFSGALAVLAAALLGGIVRHWAMLILMDVLALAGLCLVALSATPLPGGLWSIWLWTCLPALAALHFAFAHLRARLVCCGVIGLLPLIAMAVEYTHQRIPIVPAAEASTLYIVGDSITAGVGGDDGPLWPDVFRANGVRVVDYARPGATIASITQVIAGEKLGAGIVLLEIGGNDMFGQVSPQRFAADLEALIRRVKGTGRIIVMMELPLLPGNAEIGRVQRRLAAEHGVILIPKKVFAAALTGEDATIDGLHLSAAGHQRMGLSLWQILGPSLQAAPQ
jgi:lysophospholipase L1-like esterase